MEIKKVVVGPIRTNCYVLTHDNECVIIDPGEEAEKIKAEIGNNKVVGILITHHHFDHVGALEELKKVYQVPIFDFYNMKEGHIKLGSFLFDMIETPGHKEDSISFLFENHLFVGDFIFKGTVGRTDLEGGDFEVLKQSIEKIKQYSDDIIIYPGHDDITSLKEEKQNNPFF